MSRYGILIDYEYCTGCHTCEIACKKELKLPKGQWGIKVAQVGPWDIDESTVQYDFIPIPTKQCDLCEDRVAAGKQPSCVQHCQSACMKFGKVEDLAKELADKPRQVLFVPK